MQIISFTEARNNFKALLEAVCSNFEPTAITRRNGEPVVMIPLSEWNAINETEYLKSSKKNRKALMQSIKEIDEGKIVKRKLIEGY